MQEAPQHLNIAPKDDQNFRYGVTIVAYLVLVILAITLFYIKDGSVPTSIAPFDFVLLVLACFRIIRLFVIDERPTHPQKQMNRIHEVEVRTQIRHESMPANSFHPAAPLATNVPPRPAPTPEELKQKAIDQILRGF